MTFDVLKFDPTDPPEMIEFMGVVYRRMGGKRLYYLSQSRSNAGRRAAKGLHVAVWEEANGQAVPPEHDVHHRDHNTFNFDPTNLECLPRAIHRAQRKVNLDREKQNAHLAKVRPLASAWHQSEEGRAWHRQVTAAVLDKIRHLPRHVKGERPCEWCGVLTKFKLARRKFCGWKCQGQHSGWRRGKYKFIHPYFAANRDYEREHE